MTKRLSYPSKDGEGFYRQKLQTQAGECVRYSENGKTFLWLRAAFCWVTPKTGKADLRHSMEGLD